MKAELIVLLACIAFSPVQDTAIAQTLTNPSGFRGGPTVPAPVRGLTSPVGGGPRLEGMKMDLTPTLPVVSTPAVKTDQPNGLRNAEPQAAKHSIPPSPPPEPGPDGDAETPDVSGAPTVDLPLPTAGRGGQEPSVPPTSSEPGSRFSWWILIGVGLLAALLYGAKRGRRIAHEITSSFGRTSFNGKPKATLSWRRNDSHLVRERSRLRLAVKRGRCFVSVARG